MKKVTIIINNLGVGGAERVVVDDINEMIRRGIDVQLITLKAESQVSLSSECVIESRKWTQIVFTSPYDIFSWVRLIKTLRAFRPDLVVTHLWFSNTIGRIAAKIALCNRVIAFEQNMYELIKSNKMFLVDRLLQHFCTKVIAVSHIVERSLCNRGIDPRRVDVIYNSVDNKKYIEHNTAPDISKDGFKFLYVGRLIAQKAVDVLIEAFSKLPEGHLYIVGQGILRKELENMVFERGFEKRISFLGVRNDIPQIMQSCDCFVYPSRYDGFSLVLLEALSSGLPVVASDFGSNSEVIKSGEHGILVPVDDVESLARAMSEIANNSALRAKLSAGARIRAQDFSIENHVAHIMEYAT